MLIYSYLEYLLYFCIKTQIKTMRCFKIKIANPNPFALCGGLSRFPCTRHARWGNC